MASRQPTIDPLGARATLQVGDDRYAYFRLDAAATGSTWLALP